MTESGRAKYTHSNMQWALCGWLTVRVDMNPVGVISTISPGATSRTSSPCSTSNTDDSEETQ